MAVARAWCRPNLNAEVGLTPLKPYLAVLGSPPLRIEEVIPPPDLTTRPSAGAPPQPDVAADPGHPAIAAAPDAAPPSVTVAASSSTLSIAPAEDATAPTHPASTPAAASSPADEPAAPHTPAPILPDETRPQVRPEDFLPYFQIPATQPGDPNVIVPVPRQTSGSIPVPPSSATYTQTPR